MPMLILYGDADERKKECQGVQVICDPNLISVLVHEGGHEIPGTGAKSGLYDVTCQMISNSFREQGSITSLT